MTEELQINTLEMLEETFRAHEAMTEENGDNARRPALSVSGSGSAPATHVLGFAPSASGLGFAPSASGLGFAPSASGLGFAPSVSGLGFAP